MATEPILIAIVGETASGKSALALELAQHFNGEIVCADSRTAYQGMDIGTVKPSVADRHLIKHHLLDVAAPDQKFNVAQFKTLANEAITDISKRSKLPIMVGGSGLYVDSILFDYRFDDKNAARNEQNPRHLKAGDQTDRTQLRENTLAIGLVIPQEELRQRVETRVEHMVEAGLLEEVAQLAEKYGWGAPGLQSIGYQECQAYLNGDQKLEETKQQIVQHTLSYAKRQRTWFKRNKSIHWLTDPSQAVALMTTFLNK
ncbi:MAG TPA: tRNA (adenosine(37)-N6)-dimethylallyltransferase MiaA [Patescibacteria group bacterium]|nr:tRNA (adenosine(37)-N6)-dimethylallyltransferase MiaA [Patescibacteria group bacterium]